jgi:hypothetical protein
MKYMKNEILCEKYNRSEKFIIDFDSRFELRKELFHRLEDRLFKIILFTKHKSTHKMS